MGRSRSIYIVDDEAPIRRGLAMLMRPLVERVEDFDSGAAFLAAADHLPPGCVLLDIRMPGIDGLETLRTLNRCYPDLPVIIMTGHGETAMAVAALGAGAVDFVEKPFMKERLLAALDLAWLTLEDPGAYDALKRDAHAALEALAPDEQSVLEALAQGHSNKSAAAALNMDVVEVERHRAVLVANHGNGQLSDIIRLAWLGRAAPPASH